MQVSAQRTQMGSPDNCQRGSIEDGIAALSVLHAVRGDAVAKHNLFSSFFLPCFIYALG